MHVQFDYENRTWNTKSFCRLCNLRRVIMFHTQVYSDFNFTRILIFDFFQVPLRKWTSGVISYHSIIFQYNERTSQFFIYQAKRKTMLPDQSIGCKKKITLTIQLKAYLPESLELQTSFFVKCQSYNAGFRMTGLYIQTISSKLTKHQSTSNPRVFMLDILQMSETMEIASNDILPKMFLE